MAKKNDKAPKAKKSATAEAANTNEPVVKAPKPSKKKQQEIPGTERKRIAKIDEAAEKYRAVRNERQAHTKLEKAAKQELMAVVRDHKVKAYVYETDDGEEFHVEYAADTKENVKVTKVAGADDDGGED